MIYHSTRTVHFFGAPHVGKRLYFGHSSILNPPKAEEVPVEPAESRCQHVRKDGTLRKVGKTHGQDRWMCLWCGRRIKEVADA